MKRLARIAAAIAFSGLSLSSASANDGYAGVAAGGIVFEKTDKIAMEAEDLFLSRKEIKVLYRFKNLTNTDETALIAFPLPLVAPGMKEGFIEMAPGLIDLSDLNYLGFTARVGGADVKLGREVRYYKSGEDGWYQMPTAGRPLPDEVSDRLKELGVPESFDLTLIKAWFKGLPKADQDALVREGLFILQELAENDPVPAYSIGVTYYWSQVFKAGAVVEIAHTYKPVYSGSVFHTSDDLITEYCIDKGTLAGMTRIQSAIEETFAKDPPPATFEWADLKFLDYILMTANTWAGPIGTFTLTIDKEDPRDLISLCASDIKKVGPTTFRAERKDFRPDTDLHVLFVDVETTTTGQ